MKRPSKIFETQEIVDWAFHPETSSGQVLAKKN
jgi:hypothetical protein